MSAVALPPPPTAAELNLVWLLENKAVLARYMAAVYALSNTRVVVTVDGRILPAKGIKLSARDAVLEVFVS